MGSGNRKIGKMRSLAIVLLSAVALTGANPCQNDQDVYFPDREDCGRFYMCRNGEVVGHMNCPDGLLWNTDLLTCDWPRNVECTPGCPEGWSSVGDSCYFLSRERVGKFSADQEFCSNMGARLVEINSAEENEAIVGLAEAARGGCIQLLRKGATSPGNLDSYYWARAATNAKCTNNDGDNGVICEM